MGTLRSGCRVLSIALAALGCQSTEGGGGSDIMIPPPVPHITYATRVLPDTGGTFSLQVSARFQNLSPNGVTLSIEQCLVIELSDGSAQGCPLGTTTRVLAPGDTETMLGVLGPDILASFAPGTYGVAVSQSWSAYGSYLVADTVGITAANALGTVQLPLDSASQVICGGSAPNCIP